MRKLSHKQLSFKGDTILKDNEPMGSNVASRKYSTPALQDELHSPDAKADNLSDDNE